MSFLAETLKLLCSRTAEVFRRFPTICSIGITTAATGILLIAMEGKDWSQQWIFARAFITLLLAFPLYSALEFSFIAYRDNPGVSSTKKMHTSEDFAR